jgi:hypothetical protein
MHNFQDLNILRRMHNFQDSNILRRMHNFQDSNNLQNIIRLWLISLMLAMQDAVAVEGVEVGEGSQKEKSQVHYLVKVAKSGPARTLKEMSSPSDLAIKEKMETCYVPPRRSWHCKLAPTTEMMHVRSGSQRSNLCCRSPHILMQY